MDTMNKNEPNKIDYFKMFKGTLFFMTVFFSSMCGTVLFLPIYFLVYALNLDCALFIADTILSTWYAFVVALIELLLDVKIFVKGDAMKLNKNNSCLIVMNHRTRLDWLFYFALQARYGSLRRYIISLKEEIKHIPGAGWAMQAANFLFLKRVWVKDQVIIQNILNQFQRYKCSPQLLLFPEGTDFREDSKESSNRFAEKHGLPSYDYVLHPRTTGFTYIFDYMRTHNELDQVVDVTVSYPKNIMQKETDLFMGNPPKEVVFTVTCFNMDELPAGGEPGLAQWLEDRWRKKEEYLKALYENGEYIGDEGNGFTLGKNEELVKDTTLYLVGAVIFWVICLMFSGWMLTFHAGRLFYMGSCIVYTLISTFIGFGYLFPALSLWRNRIFK